MPAQETKACCGPVILPPDLIQRAAAFTVQEALRLLQPLQPSRNRPLSYDKTSGMMGTAWYYGKEIFTLLFMNGPPEQDYSNPHPVKLGKSLGQAVQFLESAAEEGEPDAMFLLAEMNFFGNYTHPRNYTEAFRRYHDLASLNGNSSAQHMIGFMYATGFGGVVERDQAKAMTYHTFAAKGGNTRAQMTTAYRHHTGIGTSRNCNDAAYWYKQVADKAVAYYRSGPPGGISLQRDAYKIADEDGGVYGEGASVVSSGVYAIKGGPNSDAHAAFDDVLEYLDLMSRKGDVKATFSLGRLHYDGSRTMKRNMKTARAYFMLVARRYWKKDGSIQDDDKDVAKFAAKAAGYLGRMFLRGEGTEQSFEKAATWFKRGVANGDALCQYSMGLMHLNGYEQRRDAVIAAEYFKEAANQDFSSAHVRLGQLYLDQGDVATASRFFDSAARNGHIEAFYHLAEIINNGIGRERSCSMATAYYKLVAEKVETIHSAFDEANRAYDEGDLEGALVTYMMAAEQGYEYAQANVAYMLDEHHSMLSFDSLIPWKKQRLSILKNAVLALIYWTRSAKQSNIDAMVKMGDYYLGGYGIEADMDKAATCYQTAAASHQSAQALWNLGWIYENGIGVEQDFHLAKRFYDQALETNQESYLPVKLSLTKLRMRSFWNTITYGKVNSIQSEPGKSSLHYLALFPSHNLPASPPTEPRKDWSFSDWLSTFLEDPHPYYHGAEDDDGYYDDPIPDRGLPGGDDDYYDELDESILESLIIVGLAAALAFLVYYRQNRQANHDRDQQQGQQAEGQAPADGQPLLPGQQPDGGFFPPRDEPGFGGWVAGGVGN